MTKIPKYRGLRIYVVAFLLYYMLISPMSSMLFITNYPKFHEKIDVLNYRNKKKKDKSFKTDSSAIQIELDTNNTGYGKIIVTPRKTKMERKNYMELESFFFELLILVFVLGFLYSLPFKIYFKNKRKNKEIHQKITVFCRKTLLHSPLIVAGIAAIPFVFTAAHMISKLFIINDFVNGLRRGIYAQYLIVFVVAGILTVMFVYYWQRHLMQTKYIEHIFTKDELRKRIYRGSRRKIKYKLLISSLMTTLLPLSIVLVYLFLSVSSIKDLNTGTFSDEELKIIFGRYYNHFDIAVLKDLLENIDLYYISVPDTFFLFGGIIMGVMVSMIYLMFFVYWSNYAIIIPVGELLKNMQLTTGGKIGNYTIVRTNDEIGELAEKYNIMTQKISAYIHDIAKMNQELEQKVKDRTAKIEQQKKEIEQQKSEVEAQRDEIEQQRDYVIKQRDEIAMHRKSITDSIEYAYSIQKALLPPDDLLKDYLKQYFIMYKPRDIVSGDFYWVHKKNLHEEKLLIAAADCTGHGVPGAFLSMLGISYLNEIVVDKNEFNPALILNKLREKVIMSLHQRAEKSKSRDGIDIALCAIDYKRKTLEYAGAYNPVYIVRKGDISELKKQHEDYQHFVFHSFETITLIEIKADKIPIGIAPKKTSNFTLKSFELKEGDEIYLFSDGYVDQFGGKNRLKFLYARFQKTLAGIYGLSMNDKLKELEEVHNNWRGSEKQIDDILVIGLKI